MSNTYQYLSVALPVPLRRTFDYRQSNNGSTPENSDPLIPMGARVEVSFGHQTMIGVVMSHHDTPSISPANIKPINRVIDPSPCMPAHLLNLCNWAANYYQHPIGEAVFSALPPSLRQGKEQTKKVIWQHTTEGKGLDENALKRSPKQQAIHQYLCQHKQLDAPRKKELGFSNQTLKALIEKGLVEESKVDILQTQDSLPQQLLSESAKTLNHEQQQAISALKYHEFNCYLLDGVTGSGKTEIYLQAIHRVLEAGNSALILVPEIGLTHQTIKRLAQRFNLPVTELHSNVSDKQRTENWLNAKAGKAKIIVGTRLAALTPVPKLGLIIIDEEHDQSYKQQDSMRYSARDLSIVRAKDEGIPIILGSATPSLETLFNAHNGRFKHLKLTQRAGGAARPQLKLIDLRKKKLFAGIERESLDAIKTTLDKKEQVLIFLNRRGYAPVVECHSCGWIANCRSCSGTMTVHRHPPHLHCHHCDRQEATPRQCPSCNNYELITQGIGTEQTEAFLESTFPETPVYRFDRDTTKGQKKLSEKLARANEGAPCILLGTQMIAKGHHFPNLTLVVILDTDQGLFSSDFRGAERMGQLITQVSGRAGRESIPGTVLLQTRNPTHPLIKLITQERYSEYSKALLNERSFSQTSPFWHMAIFRAESKRPENATDFLRMVKNILSKIEAPSPNFQYLGPLPDRIEKMNDRFRFVIQIKSSNRQLLQHVLKEGINEIDQQALAKRTRWSIDVDPA